MHLDLAQYVKSCKVTFSSRVFIQFSVSRCLDYSAEWSAVFTADVKGVVLSVHEGLCNLMCSEE